MLFPDDMGIDLRGVCLVVIIPVLFETKKDSETEVSESFIWLREPDLNRRSVDTKHLRCTLFAQTQVSATPFCSLFLPLAALANVPSGL